MSTITISGPDNGFNVDDGDTAIVENGGVASNYTINAGGEIVYQSGAIGYGGLLDNSFFVEYPPAPQEIVDTGATVTGTTLYNSAAQEIDGGTVLNTNVTGGDQIVNSGLAEGTTVEFAYAGDNLGGQQTQEIYNGGEALATNLIGTLNYSMAPDISLFGTDASQYVYSGGLAIDSTLSGASQSVTDNMTGETQVTTALGEQFVNQGGVSFGTTIKRPFENCH